MSKLALYMITLPFLFGAFAANADVWGSFPKITCIPEMDYFAVDKIEIEETHYLFEGGYPANAYEDHGFILEKSAKLHHCTMKDGITIDAEIEYFEFPEHGCRGNSESSSYLKLFISHDQNRILIFDDIFTLHCSFGGYMNKIQYHSGRFIFEWIDYYKSGYVDEVLHTSDYKSINFKPVKNLDMKMLLKSKT